MKLGIFGGTFNPIHRGHLAVAQAARARHDMDRVLVVPSGRPPHKASELAPGTDRLAMVRLAVDGVPGLVASDIEVRRPGVSYTVETLEEVAREEPAAELFFIVGADSLPELKSWRAMRRILEMVRLVAVNRPDSPLRFAPEDFPGVAPDVLAGCAADTVTMEPQPISSSAVRRAVSRGEAVDRWLPPAVIRYIEEHRLYGSGKR